MPSEFALEDLKERRLKVSLLEDMNDPFELMGARLEQSNLRMVAKRWRRDITSDTGVLCFSRRYTNPLLWSHYADKHRGICLGFEVPKQNLREISYEPYRLKLRLDREQKQHERFCPATVATLLTTKYKAWQYEEELRMFVQLSNGALSDGNYHFLPFSERLKLRHVLLGPRCSITFDQVDAALQSTEKCVEICHTRLAFKSFRVIRAGLRCKARKLKPAQ